MRVRNTGGGNESETRPVTKKKEQKIDDRYRCQPLTGFGDKDESNKISKGDKAESPNTLPPYHALYLKAYHALYLKA